MPAEPVRPSVIGGWFGPETLESHLVEAHVSLETQDAPCALENGATAEPFRLFGMWPIAPDPSVGIDHPQFLLRSVAHAEEAPGATLLMELDHDSDNATCLDGLPSAHSPCDGQCLGLTHAWLLGGFGPAGAHEHQRAEGERGEKVAHDGTIGEEGVRAPIRLD